MIWMGKLVFVVLNSNSEYKEVLKDYEVNCKLTMTFYVFLRKFNEKINIIKKLNSIIYQT